MASTLQSCGRWGRGLSYSIRTGKEIVVSNENDYVLEVPQGFLMSDEAAMDTEGGSGRHHFAALRLLIKGVTPYQAGKSFTVPGVYQDREDKANGTWVREGLREFKGFVVGGKSKLFIFVASKTSKEGREYQMVKTLKSWREKDKESGEYHFDWQNFQLPAIRQLPADVVTALESGKTLYMEFESLSTGRKFKRQDEGEGEATYWGNFKVFPTLEALEAARKELFDKIGSNGSNGTGVDMSNFPEIWNNSANPQKGVEDLYAQIRTVTGGKFADKAKELMLIGPNGQPVKKLGKDEPINLGELFAKAMDVPLTEDITQAFSHLYK